MTATVGQWEGRKPTEWADAWHIPLFDVHTELSSTNDRLKERGSRLPAFSVVLADRQTHGRGRAGKEWSSPAGGGLWFSTLAPPAESAIAAGLAPIRAGVAVVRAIRTVTGIPGEVKWPNDVWVHGRKVAGILCEVVESGIVIGIGINTTVPRGGFEPVVASTAAALSEFAPGRPIRRAALLGEVLKELRSLVPGPPALRGDVWEELKQVDALRGRQVTCSTGVNGIARGIERDGTLLVAGDTGVSSVRAGSVRVSVSGRLTSETPH